jgi:hypothetical protein
LNLLAQDDVVDHFVQYLRRDPGRGVGVGRPPHDEAQPLLQIDIGDDLAVDHGHDAVHDLGGLGVSDNDESQENRQKKLITVFFHESNPLQRMYGVRV